jgi:double-strand break repair protein MRE11
VTNVEDIVVNPVLFTKGKTKLALYGIGHMKDERLNLAFEKGKIRFARPTDKAG